MLGLVVSDVVAQLPDLNITSYQLGQMELHIFNFSMQVYNMLEKPEHKNMGLSPFSLHLGLGNLLAGASGTTREELEKVLGYWKTCQGTPCQGLPEVALVHLYQDVIDFVTDNNSLNVSNALFVKGGLEVHSTYLHAVKNYFKADMKRFKENATKGKRDSNGERIF